MSPKRQLAFLAFCNSRGEADEHEVRKALEFAGWRERRKTNHGYIWEKEGESTVFYSVRHSGRGSNRRVVKGVWAQPIRDRLRPPEE